MLLSQPQSRVLVAGASAGFTVTAPGTQLLGYQWLFNGAPVASGGQLIGADTASLARPWEEQRRNQGRRDSDY